MCSKAVAIYTVTALQLEVLGNSGAEQTCTMKDCETMKARRLIWVVWLSHVSKPPICTLHPSQGAQHP
jgi:hypothetical protein